MFGSGEEDRELYRFVEEKIDSVPHLEALLLVWNSRPKVWTPEDLGARLYVQTGDARVLLEDLRRSGLIAAAANPPGACFYQMNSEEQHRLIALLDEAYRKRLVQVSTMIHSKAPSSVRDFARAFRFTKERE